MNLYKTLSSCVISKLEPKFKSNTAAASLSPPDGETTFAAPPTFFILNPGLLSMVCSPGMRRIVVFSIKSLDEPFKYEKRADSKIALWIVLKGLARELPWLSILSVASRSDGLTYKIRPSVFLIKLSNLFRGMVLQLLGGFLCFIYPR